MTAHGQGPPRTTVAQVMADIIRHYVAVADPLSAANRILVGERRKAPLGAPPRLVMVRAGGNVTGPDTMGDGNLARFPQGFRAYLWGAETVDDLTRYDAVDDMFDRFVNVVRKVIPGRCAITVVDPADTSVQTFGEQLQVLVTFSRGVPRDAAVWAVPVTPVSPPDPMRPNGDTGTMFDLDAAVEGSR